MAYKDKNNPTMVACTHGHNGFCFACENTDFVIDPKERLCNQCGNSLDAALDSHSFQSDYGLRDIKVQGGYPSYHLLDMTTYEFSLCEKCLRHLFLGFKIKPDLTDEFGDPESWEADQEQYEERLWRSSGAPAENYNLLARKKHLFSLREQLWHDKGGMELKYKAGICNATLSCANKAKFSYQDDETEELTYNCSCDLEDCMMEFEYTYLQVPFVKEELRVFV